MENRVARVRGMQMLPAVLTQEDPEKSEMKQRIEAMEQRLQQMSTNLPVPATRRNGNSAPAVTETRVQEIVENKVRRIVD